VSLSHPRPLPHGASQWLGTPREHLPDALAACPPAPPAGASAPGRPASHSARLPCGPPPKARQATPRLERVLGLSRSMTLDRKLIAPGFLPCLQHVRPSHPPAAAAKATHCSLRPFSLRARTTPAPIHLDACFLRCFAPSAVEHEPIRVHARSQAEMGRIPVFLRDLELPGHSGSLEQPLSRIGPVHCEHLVLSDLPR